MAANVFITADQYFEESWAERKINRSAWTQWTAALQPGEGDMLGKGVKIFQVTAASHQPGVNVIKSALCAWGGGSQTITVHQI